MNKLNEADPTDVGNQEKKEEEFARNGETKEEGNGMEIGSVTTDPEAENYEKGVLKFTMLFNKYSSVMGMKRRNEEEKRDNKYAMFFNKEVTIRRTPETFPATATKVLEAKKSGFFNPRRNHSFRPNRMKSKFHPHNFPEPQFSEPGVMFCASLFSSLQDVCERKTQPGAENPRKFLNRRTPRKEDSLLQLNVHPATQGDLRNHNSLTNLSKNNRLCPKGALESKIPSLTALDVNPVHPKSGFSRYWDHRDDLILIQSDVEKRLNLQISRSSNDNNRRSVLKFKKEEAASVSDSKLLYADSECKRHIKKCDKKSRGDSPKKERSCGSRKQVQWKTEVDVIYFSTHMAANGDRTGEVIGRVLEPLREEWEQQRKGFYAKLVPSHMESHVKDHFISLLKI